MASIFALLDCNNFYVSCERVFNPKLEGQPVLVLSNNDGCAIARCNEAKRLGIQTGVPVFKVRHLIQAHGIQVYSSNYSLYGDLSARVMATLEAVAPAVEIYSIDEAFLDLSTLKHQNLTQYGRYIRATVRQWTGIPVSIGIGPSKTLAKIANQMAKKLAASQGVCNLMDLADPAPILEKTNVADVWGIGRHYAKRLRSHGIENALQLRDVKDTWIRQLMGVVGLRIVLELRGVSCLPLELCPTAKKSITVSRSFGHSVESLTELKEAVATYTSRAAEKLRRDQLGAGVLTVFLLTDRHRKDEPQYYNSKTIELPVNTNNTAELLGYALRGIESIYAEGYCYKKAGVLFNELMADQMRQTNLFDYLERDQAQKLMEVMDQVNQRWGAGTLKFAAVGLHQQWRMRAECRSPRYTTCWNDLPIVKCR